MKIHIPFDILQKISNRFLTGKSCALQAEGPAVRRRRIGVILGMAHPMQMGKRTRMCFARIEEALAVPDLIEVQKKSYEYFLKEGLREVLADVSPITDYSESLILEFTDYSLDDKPKYTVDKCKERDTTYAAPLKVTVRLTNRDTHEIKESEVFMGDFPLMTEHGTFIINGAERVIVSQLVRSPGVYYSKEQSPAGLAPCLQGEC